ncbi:MAG: hypothetical protein LUF35_04365 [Lachnospiraceae bacterium]|nr:hypothetical protein [Lachnospiraceae bacterium]
MREMDPIEKLICDTIDAHREEIIEFGKDLWHHAELGYREFRTSQKLKEYLQKLGMKTVDGLAITGVKGYLKENSDGTQICFYR